jgi:hypothetical protein
VVRPGYCGGGAGVHGREWWFWVLKCSGGGGECRVIREKKEL